MNRLACQPVGDEMHQIGAFEAKNRLGSLLDRVERGEEIIITRRGKAVAKLVPADGGFDREKARRAAAGLVEASRGLSLDSIKIKDLIEEGRS
jgi:prevent-host-death family protein